MKKIMVLILMLIVLIGCGKEKDINILVVGTNAEYKPYEYLDGDKLVGFDIELMEELAKNMGYKIEWKNMSFDGLIPALQAKKIDAIIAGMTPTPERAKAVDFTDIYYSSSQAIIVGKENNEIKSLEDLKGKTVGVQLGTIQETMASKIDVKKIKRYNSFSGAILELNAKKIDAVIIGGVVADHYLENNNNLKLGALLEDQQDGSAIALGKGKKELVEQLNQGINKIKESGKYEELVNKYFGEEI